MAKKINITLTIIGAILIVSIFTKIGLDRSEADAQKTIN